MCVGNHNNRTQEQALVIGHCGWRAGQVMLKATSAPSVWGADIAGWSSLSMPHTRCQHQQTVKIALILIDWTERAVDNVLIGSYLAELYNADRSHC